jgi:NADH-quinone oxidoreductase subunit E
MFSLKGVECLGACGYAPMFQIGETYYEHLTNEKVDEILDNLRSQKQSNNVLN